MLDPKRQAVKDKANELAAAVDALLEEKSLIQPERSRLGLVKSSIDGVLSAAPYNEE